MSTTSSKKFKDIGPRFISAVLMSIVCFVPVYFGGLLFLALALLIGLRIGYEWVRMSDKEASKLAYVLMMGGIACSVICGYFGLWAASLGFMLITAIVTAIERWPRGGVNWAGFGTLYLVLPSLAMLFVRGEGSGYNAAGFQQFMFVLLIVVGADVGAYIGGSALGGPKIAPKLSPKKTWSGFLSGLVLGTIVGVACAYFMQIPYITAIMLSVPIVVFSVMGDFLESGVKRQLNVKDTGTFLPGHGGVLDRIDSVMFAMTFFAFALVLFPAS